MRVRPTTQLLPMSSNTKHSTNNATAIIIIQILIWNVQYINIHRIIKQGLDGLLNRNYMY
jgi:hypothetical protein